MSLRITITRTVPNPDYDPKLTTWHAPYNDERMQQQRTLTVQTLDTEVTEEQFEAVRKALVEVL